MADRKKGGKKNKNEVASDKLSKEDESVAKFVRFNCPTKTTMFEGNEVHYFTAAKAVETLVDSKKYGTNAKTPRFIKKEDAFNFMEDLLHRGYFFRAKKLVLKKKPIEEKKDDKKKDKEEKLDSKKSSKKSKPETGDSETNGESAAEGKKDKKDQKESEEDSKKKKKVKLIAHDSQIFIDSNDVYVWIFDPTPLYKKVIGLLMVLGTIAGCLFPLWPDWLRLGVYYVSVVGICLFGVLLGVALARTALFGIIWAVTMGRHKLWLLPNLTEDCGFFESFKPWYTYEYCPGGKSKEDEKKSKKKDKNSDDEQDDKEEEKTKPEKSEPETTVMKENDEESKNSDEESENGSSNEISDEEAPQELDQEVSETASDVSPKSARKRRPRREDEGFVLVK